MTVEFTVAGVPCLGVNGGPAFMSQALDDSRNAFSKAIEVTAKRFDEAAKG